MTTSREMAARQLDRWADWLLNGRQRGLSEAQRRRADALLRRSRDRVLRGARLRPGQRVLDVGAGTGLLTLAVLGRAGASGQVVALDLSFDALGACRQQARTTAPALTANYVTGDVRALPFPDQSFDVVVARSVLMYVPDRQAAVRELHRVLRPGGRASLFEPINAASRRYTRNLGLDLSAVEPAYRRVTSYWRQTWHGREAILSLDDRELFQLFVNMGFGAVESSCDVRHVADRPMTRQAARALLWARPDPSRLSYEEAARAVLGASAEEHLARLIQILRSQATTQAEAVVYLTAQR